MVKPFQRHEQSEGPGHGYCSHAQWQLVKQTDEEILIEVKYPEDNDIDKLVQRIYPTKDEPKLNVELQIFARKSCNLPIAVHPTLRLDDWSRPSASSSSEYKPAKLYSNSLLPGAFNFGVALPGKHEPSSIIKPFTRFESLEAIEVLTERRIKDFSRFPLEENTENVVQLCNCNGRFAIYNQPSNTSFVLEWEKEKFNSVQIWMSNRGKN